MLIGKAGNLQRLLQIFSCGLRFKKKKDHAFRCCQ